MYAPYAQREEKAAAQKNAAAKLFLTQPEVTREASLLKLTTPTPPPEDDLELEGWCADEDGSDNDEDFFLKIPASIPK